MHSASNDTGQPSNDNGGGTDGTEDRDIRLRRIRFRAWHRGIREMDLLIGGFADLYLHDMDDATLTAFEMVLQVPDQDLYNVVIRDDEPPFALDPDLLQRLRTHCQNNPLG